MKIVFIYPDIVTPIISFCPSIYPLSAVLKREGHQTSLIHVNNDYGITYNREIIIDQVRIENPDLIGITSTSSNYKYANEIAGWLKKEFPDVPRVLGGAHAIVQPEDCLNSNFDAFCIGEGEEVLLDIITCIKNKEDWKKVSLQRFVRNLDSLPYWDYDIEDTYKILELRGGWMSVSFSRGCPYECAFCVNPLYKRRGMTPRRRSPENVVNELGSLVEKFKGQIKLFNFDDDLLSTNKRWMKEFAERYRNQILDPFGIKYVMNFRASSLDDNMASLVATSGCFEARIGVETGNEVLRTEVLNKHVSNAELIRAFSVCDKYKIRTFAFAMMGVPGETEDTFKDTVAMILRLKPYLIRMSFLSPYPHTKIFDLCVKQSLFKSHSIPDDTMTESPLRFEKLTDKQISNFRFLFPWYVNALWFGEPYKSAIDQFVSLPYLTSEIIEKDKEISAHCKLPHYKYFEDNNYYFQLKGKYKNSLE